MALFYSKKYFVERTGTASMGVLAEPKTRDRRKQVKMRKLFVIPK
jgi:hypothetical protein